MHILVELYNKLNILIELYNQLNILEENFSYCTFIFEILGMILTFITFLTVMMSVQYQENAYNAKQIEFEIKNEKDTTEINNKIQKLKFINKSIKIYRQCINIFIIIAIIILSIIAVIAPIYYVQANSFVKILLALVQILLAVVIFVLYRFFHKDTKTNYYEKTINAMNYRKTFSSEINIFPKLEFKEGFAILKPTIIDLRNYFVAIKINFGISDFFLLGYKNYSSMIDLDNLPNVKIPFDFNMKNQNISIDYYVKIEEEFFCLDSSINNDKTIIEPTKIKNKSITKDIIEFEKNIDTENILVYK